MNFDGIREAGHIVAKVLDEVSDYVKPGVTTEFLDAVCLQAIFKLDAKPALVGYSGYPNCSCISPNHVVCHGIPSDKKLVDGDIINIDVTVEYNGWFGDSSRMFFVGKPSVKARNLCKTTFEAMWKGIEQCKPGNTIGDIGWAIQSHAEANRFSVVREYVGHGVGQAIHMEPQVPHYGKPGTGLVLEPGMIFTIEPMVNAGKPETKVLSDNWTVVTRDRSLSAQFEHTVGITDSGFEVFTISPAGKHHPDW